jgi:hypothetical protein
MAINKPESGAADNLTGVWNGVFQQPHYGSVAFTATLIESANQVTGSMHERCALPGCPHSTHLALLCGRVEQRRQRDCRDLDHRRRLVGRFPYGPRPPPRGGPNAQEAHDGLRRY